MRTRTMVGAAAFYVALTLALTYPFSTHLTNHVLSGGTDMDLAIWTIGWDVHAFTHAPWAIFDANIFYPFHNSLAYSENLIGSALMAAPVIWMTGNVVLGMNIAALFSVAASAFGTFLLAHRLRLSVMAALIAGIIAGFAPPRFFRLDQLPISSVQWIPFTLLALHAYFDTRRARYLRVAVALYSLQALTSGHGTAMLTLAVAMLLIWKYLHGEPAAVVQRFKDIGWPGALALAPAALIYVPYKMAQIEVGLKRQLDDWTLSTPSFFTSPTIVHQWLLSHMPNWAWLRGEPDAWLFPGVLPIVLGLIALWWHASLSASQTPGRAWRRTAVALELLTLASLALAVWVTISGGVKVKAGNTVLFTSHGIAPWIYTVVLLVVRLSLTRRAPVAPVRRLLGMAEWFSRWRRSLNTVDHLWLYAAMAALTLWLAIGPPFGIWRFMYWMPGLNFVRMPSRFTVVGMMALGLIAASGFDRLTAHARAVSRLVAGVVCVGLLIGEFALVPMPNEPIDITPSAIDRWVGTQTTPMTLIEMPLSDSRSDPRREQWTTRFMLHSMAHWKPMFLGFSGIQPPGYQDNYWTLVNFPDEPSIALLKQLGISHVILHTELVHPTETELVRDKYLRFADQVRLIHTEGEGRVYEIR